MAGGTGKQPSECKIVDLQALWVFAHKDFLDALKEGWCNQRLVVAKEALSGFLDFDFADVKAAVKQERHAVPPPSTAKRL
jgi:hypothetical protein